MDGDAALTDRQIQLLKFKDAVLTANAGYALLKNKKDTLDLTLGPDASDLAGGTGADFALLTSAQLLTMDGLPLNSVYLFGDMEEGDSFMKERKRENPVPKFSADMSELELVEFVTESLERGGGLLNVKAANIAPATFKG